MNTDPLCPQQHTHPKHNPNRCIFCKYGAAVRADERERIRAGVTGLRWTPTFTDLLVIDQADVLAVIDGGE